MSDAWLVRDQDSDRVSRAALTNVETALAGTKSPALMRSHSASMSLSVMRGPASVRMESMSAGSASCR
ncbi:hypothetical protein XAP6984_210007 [Xanthomonas phaseoli pv. phaseoli]|uniref:Uncharacterized protein n=1 Tax=Xanthomonas campestris pv. phaseoli TaxID=317013 RepID=A0ABY1TP75_XANCH|nr:hypothetical protein XAP6984_210007 [Xanthomonas phaseoli pv. phaseoli]